MLAENVAFGILALVMGVSALRVVTTKNVVHAALYLVLVLAGVAGIFILLGAEFVGITQVLVYIGAIVVLFLFGVMLTRAKIGQDVELTNRKAIFGGVTTALLLLGVMGYALIDEYGWTRTKLPVDTRIATVNGSNTATVSDNIFSQYLVPFEAVSVLLLAALVGAIVLAKRD